MKRYILANRTILIVAIILLAVFTVSCISGNVPASTTLAEVVRGHLEIATQGKTYKPIENFVYSLHDGIFADRKRFDKLALDMDPELNSALEAAESIPYADDFTFIRVWPSGSEKGVNLRFDIFDSQMVQIINGSDSFSIPAGDGLYYIATLIHVGNDKEYAGYQYIFKVVRSAWDSTTTKG